MCVDPLQKKLPPSQKKIVSSSLHCNGDTIHIGQEIQCLLYAGFFSLYIHDPFILSLDIHDHPGFYTQSA